MTIDAPYSDLNANTATGALVSPEVPTNKTANHTAEAKNIVSNGDLPWCPVLLSPESAGQSGIGWNKHNLQPETWVYGFFADGDDCQQPLIVSVIPGGPGGGTSFNGYDNEAAPDGVTPVLSGGENVEKAFKYLVLRGYTAEQAAGIVGCLQAESGADLNPGSYNPNDVGKPSFGIAQWRAERMQSLIAYAKARGAKPNDLGVQLEYLVHEMKNRPQDSGTAERLIQNANNPRDAAIAFINFERPAGAWSAQRARLMRGNGTDPNNSQTRRRIQFALGVYKRMKEQGVKPVAQQVGQSPRGDS